MKLKEMNKELLRHHAGRMKTHATRVAKVVHKHGLSTPKKLIITLSVTFVMTIVVAQLVYPTDKLVYFMNIDGVAVGGSSKKEAVEKLNSLYGKATVPIHYNNDPKPKATPAFKDIGMTVSNEARIQSLDYPWFWRLIPSSILWHHAVTPVESVSVTRSDETLKAYMDKTFGAECKIEPVNATITLKDEKLEVVNAIDGGTCDYNELRGALKKVSAVSNPDKVTVNGTTIAPAVDDAKAQAVREGVVAKIGEKVTVQAEGKSEAIPAKTVLSWLDFSVDGSNLIARVNHERAAKVLNDAFGAHLAIKPGVTTITTRDFAEISRVSGPNGRALDVAATAAQLSRFIRGEVGTAAAVARAVPATLAYNRSYSSTDEGMTALMKHFAESHPGTYGISLVELSGARRHANYNGGKQFITASTYKLFVAYSALLRIENGSWNWNDQIAGGRNLTKCFDDMIVKSDNECAKAMLLKIGFKNITNEARAIGANDTSFLDANGIKSTAKDESLLLSLLHSGQILSQQSNRDTFINALKRNVYRNGIPAGVRGSAVANKVGFMDGLLHDAGIVYSPSGAYVLVVLTDGSSWANIAELTKQLEALRNGS